MATNTEDIVAHEKSVTQAQDKIQAQDRIVAQARDRLDALMESACRKNPLDTKNPADTLCALEKTIFESVLEIGRLAVEAHLVVQAIAHRHETAVHPSGMPLSYHSERDGTGYTYDTTADTTWFTAMTPRSYHSIVLRGSTPGECAVATQ